MLNIGTEPKKSISLSIKLVSVLGGIISSFGIFGIWSIYLPYKMEILKLRTPHILFECSLPILVLNIGLVLLFSPLLVRLNVIPATFRTTDKIESTKGRIVLYTLLLPGIFLFYYTIKTQTSVTYISLIDAILILFLPYLLICLYMLKRKSQHLDSRPSRFSNNDANNRTAYKDLFK
jgi:hypothetical protein